MKSSGEVSDEDRPAVTRTGYLNSRMTRGVVFVVLTLCILSGVVVSILAIWDYAERDVLYRTLATLGVVALGSLMFGLLNDRFGT
jgi:hypothetical protein